MISAPVRAMQMPCFHATDTHFPPPLHTRQAGYEDRNTSRTTTRPASFYCCLGEGFRPLLAASRPTEASRGSLRLLPARSSADQERGGPSIFPTCNPRHFLFKHTPQHVHIHHLPLLRRDGAAVRSTKACCVINTIVVAPAAST